MCVCVCVCVCEGSRKRVRGMEGNAHHPMIIAPCGEDPLASAVTETEDKKKEEEDVTERSERVEDTRGGNDVSTSMSMQSAPKFEASKLMQQVLRRRKLLADVFANSRFNVLDAARRERWDDVERVRREVEDADAWISAPVPEEVAGGGNPQENGGDAEMRRKFYWSDESWKQVFEKLILTDDEASATTTRDDLLYFVQNAIRLRSRASSSILQTPSGRVTQQFETSPSTSSSSSTATAATTMSSSTTTTTTGNQPPPKSYDDLHVRRWQPQLPADIESMSDCYHWQSSLLLNLILQTQYVMTIAVYDSDTLNKKRELQLKSPGGGSTAEHNKLKPILEVRKRVYASPHFEIFDGSSKGFSDRDASTGMQQSFPTLYFAVCDDNDGERDLLESVILSDPEHCLCIILNASLQEDIWGRGGGPENPLPDDANGGSSSEDMSRSKTERVKLFSGFVTYAQVTDSYREQSGWKGYLSRRASTRLGMRGPRGKGRAEVAVEESPREKKEKSDATAGNSKDQSETSSTTGVMRKVASSFSVRRVMNAARVRCPHAHMDE